MKLFSILFPLLASHAAPFVSFPPGFKWCVGTSAHQFEGDNFDSDWWEFEKIPGKIKNGETSGKATDHWNRIDEDLSLVKGLNVSVYRFSLEWAKIEPREGEWDLAAVAHYRHIMRVLREYGIQAHISLYHMTLPRWLADRGGFAWSGAPAAFARYARFVQREIAPEAHEWSTSVDAASHILFGSLTDKIPPGRNGDFRDVKGTLIGFLKAHAAAYHALHLEAARAGHQIRVGITHHLRNFDPADKYNPLDALGAKAYDFVFNWLLSDTIKTGQLKIYLPFFAMIDQKIPGLKGTQDFVAIAYYTRSLVKIKLGGPIKDVVENSLITRPGAPVSDMGWEIYPEGMYRILKAVQSHYPGTPIVIAENGLADRTDAKRPAYIKSYLKEVRRALDDGVPVDTYCSWALTDNFEWVEGFSPRFGLYEIDYKTFRRIKRPSADLFSGIALHNGF